MNTIEQFNAHVMGSYGRFDLVLEKGENQLATDENGKQYIDLAVVSAQTLSDTVTRIG